MHPQLYVHANAMCLYPPPCILTPLTTNKHPCTMHNKQAFSNRLQSLDERCKACIPY